MTMVNKTLLMILDEWGIGKHGTKTKRGASQMKVIVIIATLLALCGSNVFAQNENVKEETVASNSGDYDAVSCQQSFSVVDSDRGDLMVFNGYCMKSGYTNPKIGMKEGSVESFIKLLKKYGKKAKEWAETAQKENVTNFWKQLTPLLHKPIDVRYLQFDCGGTTIWKYYDNSMMSMTNCSTDAYFQVNKDGATFLVMHVSYTNSDFKVQTGKSLVTATVVGSHVGTSTTKELETYNPGGIRIAIPTDEIDAFYESLTKAFGQFDKRQKDAKAKNKLFK